MTLSEQPFSKSSQQYFKHFILLFSKYRMIMKIYLLFKTCWFVQSFSDRHWWWQNMFFFLVRIAFDNFDKMKTPNFKTKAKKFFFFKQTDLTMVQQFFFLATDKMNNKIDKKYWFLQSKCLHDSERESDDEDLDRALKQISFAAIWMLRFVVMACWIQEWVGIGLKRKKKWKNVKTKRITNRVVTI